MARFNFFIVIMAILFMTLSCEKIPVSLSGDTEEYLYETLSGNWRSLDNTVQYQFTSVSNFLIMTNGANYSKGYFGLAVGYGINPFQNSGGIYFITTHLFNGGSWSNVAFQEIMPYLIYENGGKFALSVYLKTAGSFVENEKNGTYISFYRYFIETNRNVDELVSDHQFFYIQCSLLTISESQIDESVSIAKSFTNSGTAYFFAGFTSDFSYENYSVSIKSPVWLSESVQYSQTIFAYTLYQGIMTNLVVTNTGAQTKSYFQKSAMPKGFFMICDSNYSNNIFVR